MSHDRRRPAQQNPDIDPFDERMLRLQTYGETAPARKIESERLATKVMLLLRHEGFDCGTVEEVVARAARTPGRTLH